MPEMLGLGRKSFEKESRSPTRQAGLGPGGEGYVRGTKGGSRPPMNKASSIDDGRCEESHLRGQQGSKECRPAAREASGGPRVSISIWTRACGPNRWTFGQEREGKGMQGSEATARAGRGQACSSRLQRSVEGALIKAKVGRTSRWWQHENPSEVEVVKTQVDWIS